MAVYKRYLIVARKGTQILFWGSGWKAEREKAIIFFDLDSADEECYEIEPPDGFSQHHIQVIWHDE
jgi:hypothetical protein